MDQSKRFSYKTILGRNPQNPLPYEERVVVSLTLPRLGEHGFKWFVGEDREYGHYSFRPYPKARPVNVHVYGERKHIEHLAESGKPVKCELELVVKKTSTDREFILVNLYLTKPWLRDTHTFVMESTLPDPTRRAWFVYATKDMHGTGISVRPIV